MTVYSAKQNAQDNEKLQQVFKVVPDLKMYVVRNSKIDGRIGCGLGYNVVMLITLKTSALNLVMTNGKKIVMAILKKIKKL